MRTFYKLLPYQFIKTIYQIINSILLRFDQKNHFFEEWSWFKFNNLGLALGTNVKFYTSVTKGLKLKVRMFCGLILTFIEVTGEKLVGGTFPPTLPAYWIRSSQLEASKDKDKDISNFRHWEGLEIKYSIRVKRLNVVIEELKQRITATAAKGRRYQGRVDSYRQNRLFAIIKGSFTGN